MVKNPLVMRETWVQSWVEKIPWRRKQLSTSLFWPGKFHRQRRLAACSSRSRICKESDMTNQLSLSLHKNFPGGSDGKVSVYNVGDLGSIPGLGRIPGEGNGNPLQYCRLENPMNGRAWCPWGHKESDTTEQLHFTSLQPCHRVTGCLSAGIV